MEHVANNDEAYNLLTQYLEETGCRKTQERYAILNAVSKVEKHFTSDELYDYMKDVFRVSRATVYSTLELLSKVGILDKHQFLNVVRYEYSLGVKPHSHQICSECGSVKDVFSDEIDKSVSSIKLKRFRVRRYDMYIYGICTSCATKIRRAKSKKMQKSESSKTYK